MTDYQTGFGNGFETEALPGRAAHRPELTQQVCLRPVRRAAEWVTVHRAARISNERSWLYRIRPTVRHWGRFRKVDAGLWRSAPDTGSRSRSGPCGGIRPDPGPSRSPLFDGGVRTITTAGDVVTQAGMATTFTSITRSMQDEYFYNGDGEMLFVLHKAGSGSGPSSASSTPNPAKSWSSPAA